MNFRIFWKILFWKSCNSII